MLGFAGSDDLEANGAALFKDGVCVMDVCILVVDAQRARLESAASLLANLIRCKGNSNMQVLICLNRVDAWAQQLRPDESDDDGTGVGLADSDIKQLGSVVRTQLENQRNYLTEHLRGQQVAVDDLTSADSDVQLHASCFACKAREMQPALQCMDHMDGMRVLDTADVRDWLVGAAARVSPHWGKRMAAAAIAPTRTWKRPSDSIHTV